MKETIIIMSVVILGLIYELYIKSRIISNYEKMVDAYKRLTKNNQEQIECYKKIVDITELKK